MEKNQAQEQVIHTINGQVIVIACPGSGKTTTLVRRIHYMVSECQIAPEHILMVTFTSAAAKEMKQRYQSEYGVDEVTFSTIHSLCLAILRKFKGLSKENIMTNQQSFFYEQLRTNRVIRDKEEFIKLLLTDISVLKNSGELVLQCTEDKELFLSLYHAYEEYKTQMDLIDFDDMLLEAYALMKDDPEVLHWLRERYQYIQIDEFQDTNFKQRDILYLLAGENGNLAVVGDDDQSIYGFRGAKPEIMLEFKKTFPDAKMIHLDTNYRSNQEIIKVADWLIKKNNHRFSKQFIGFRKDKGAVDIINSKTRTSQLLTVINKVKKLIEEGVNPNEIAILYRTNQQAEAIANMLLRNEVPFTSNEKIKSRYQHWIFEDILSYWKLSQKKGTKQDLARVINHPNRYLNDYKYVQAGLNQKKMIQVANSLLNGWKRNKAYDEIMDFFWGLEKLSETEPVKFLSTLNLQMKYLTYLKEYADYRNIEFEELVDLWNQYIADAREHNEWKDWSLYIVRYNKALEAAQKKKEGVKLSTMHCSKGLEWEHVFIIDCTDEYCPYKKAKTPEAIEEERRLFYVAMTRAKEHLYMCTYETNGTKSVGRSIFLPAKKRNRVPINEKK